MTTSPRWLDILPAIPLARSVPLLHIGTARSLVALHHGPDGWVCHDFSRHTTPIPESLLRVDLDDPQGFAYALRKLPTGRDLLPSGVSIMLTSRHLSGRTTDADRLALALEVFHDEFRREPKRARQLLDHGEIPRDETLDLVEAAAYAMVAHTLFNLDEFLTR